MLVPDEARVWASAFCNCAIEGNRLGIYMCELWNRDKKRFLEELQQFLLRERSNKIGGHDGQRTS